MEVGSSSLPGTTHRTKSAMCTGSKSAWDYTSPERDRKLINIPFIHGGLAQLARAPALQAGGQRFESVILHHAVHVSEALPQNNRKYSTRSLTY